MPSTPLEILQNTFGYDTFRGLQQDIIEELVAGQDALVLMPTGGGKSLCYQIPALVRPGTGIVVSPLIALMQDQVEALLQLGIKAAYLNSSLSLEEQKRIEEQLISGGLDLLYAAPERLLQDRFLSLLKKTSISLFAIDEAHCVSQWGHDFRQDYLGLSVIHDFFPNVPRIALTATADERTKNEIEKRLGLEKAKKFISSFDRPNIRYIISVKQNPNKQLLDFLKLQPKGDAGIIYRLTRKSVEETAKYLASNGYKAIPYHAGMELTDREKNQRRFLVEEGVIVVATIAFGMGIDKPNVRFVVHLDLPKSLEGYYQETGRAGRDGLAAIAWMIYGLEDIKTLNYIIEKSELNQLPKHLQKVQDEELLAIEKMKLKKDRIRYKEIEKSKLSEMLALCETSSCRRQAILRYFSEELPKPCGNCDNCLSPPATWDGTDAARKALSCAYRAGQRFGAHHLIDILLGRNSERMDRLGHRHLSTYGIGRDLDEKQWLSVFRQLITLGYLQVDHEGHGALKLTEAARPILRGETALLLRRDDEKRLGRRTGATSTALADLDNHRLWEELRQLRKQLAETQGVPPYVIFQDAVLMEMIERRPTNLSALGQLSGVGVRKLERYGEDFLRVINRHRRTAGPKSGMTDTVTETLNLFRLGLTAEQIAGRRSLKTSTVLDHLALAIRQGQLAAKEVVDLPEAEIDRISRVWNGLPDEKRRGVKALHEAFEGKYDYSLLRCLHAELLHGGAGS